MDTIRPDAAGIARGVEVLREGGVVAHATETCYGLACDLRNPDAVAQLFAMKERAPSMPMSALFASVEEAKKYVVWSARAEELACERLPGPLTMVLPLQDDAAGVLHVVPTEEKHPGTIGVRVSSHKTAAALVEAFGSPISTTSANVSGQPNIYSAEGVVAAFATRGTQPDLVLDDGVLPEKPASRIVDLCGENERFLR